MSGPEMLSHAAKWRIFLFLRERKTGPLCKEAGLGAASLWLSISEDIKNLLGVI
jgi:hypothetical protein